MGRGCRVTATFFGVAAATFILYVIVVMAMSGPGGPGDNGGAAMGAFMFALTTGPFVACAAGAFVALLVWVGTTTQDE